MQKGGDRYRGESKKQRRLRVGKTILGISAAITADGVLFGIFGLASGNDWVLGAAALQATVGGILLIIGLIVVAIGSSTPDSPEEKAMQLKRDPHYMDNLEKAVSWVNEQQEKSDKKLEDIVIDATEKFNVEFNDVWELVE